ncbi:MAG: cytochrome C oxidase subunit II [Microbacteriaceae bacterium BACL25 MAG-120322-bin65]|nr:MAG: cytochrome C oxidase subunit II [Microbacteriaceae bacterium BACL25 MAG-120322-bin65]HAA79938.1 cytochrome c oxidase subunit II [Microbacteriaceae bacterium]
MNFKRRLKGASLLTILAVVLAGCTAQSSIGWLPTERGLTNQVDRVIDLWVVSWIVLLVVGVITWLLLIWATVVYRRRKGQTGLPTQLRYNMPIEVFYTIVPLILVLVLFGFTARDQIAIEQPLEDPDVSIEVYGKRWAWDFNYLNENVYSAGIQAQELPGGRIETESLPVLYLPVDQKVEITIESRDVIHSFWIIDFLYKKDMIPSRTNYWYFVPQKEGVYRGKCAELCGEYHSMMLFEVRVVSVDEYNMQMAALRANGNVGRLGPELNTLQNLPGTTPLSEGE